MVLRSYFEQHNKLGIFFGYIWDCAALCHRSYLESSNYANPDYPRKDLHYSMFLSTATCCFSYGSFGLWQVLATGQAHDLS